MGLRQRGQFLAHFRALGTAGRESEPAYFGWLNTELPAYPDTLDLKVNVHTRPVGERPFVEVEPTEHPLALEQRHGLSWEQVQARIEQLLHGSGSPGPTSG